MPLIPPEQLEQARGVDLLTYLQTHEPHSIRKSGPNEYCLVEHDSLKISNGRWNWFSRGFGGYNALDFLVKVRGLDFPDAVNHLTGGAVILIPPKPPPKAVRDKPPKPFTLPPANVNNDKLIAYLRGRGIDSGVVRRCVEKGLLYEAAKSHNCVFVGYGNDNPKFACERGISDDYKKDVFGSDKRFGFVLSPKDPSSHNLAVTEAPIDALSHASIHEIGGTIRVPAKSADFVGEGGTAEHSGFPPQGGSSEAQPVTTWDGYRLSLGGVSSLALMGFLEQHPEIKSIQLCLDNDKAGQNATNRIISELLSNERFSHLKISVVPPPIGKDYNDTLKAVLQLNREQSRTGRPDKAAFAI